MESLRRNSELRRRETDEEKANGGPSHGFQQAFVKRRVSMLLFNEDPPLRSPQSSPLGHRVMLVDEDTRDLKHLTSLLEGMGHSVHAFSDHREAERYLEHGNFDLVIMCQIPFRLPMITKGVDRVAH